MPTLTDRKALAHTLDQAGLGHVPFGKIEWLDHSGSSIEGNTKVHRSTNDLIAETLASSDLGRCIHVTGDMRALLDPFHRDLCAAMYRRTGRSFSVLFDLPRDVRSNEQAALRHSITKWESKRPPRWEDYLRTFDVIGDRAVDIFASNTNDQIQYSVFGNEYVQLQGKHTEAAKSKPVWLLKSEMLNLALADRAQKLIDSAADIDERWYRKFLMSLSGLGARAILKSLASGSTKRPEEFESEPVARLDGISMSDATAVLDTMKFISNTKDGCKIINPRGREFLQMLER